MRCVPVAGWRMWCSRPDESTSKEIVRGSIRWQGKGGVLMMLVHEPQGSADHPLTLCHVHRMLASHMGSSSSASTQPSARPPCRLR
jgi:hypothetical protein